MISRATALLDVTPRAARLSIDKLVEAGILTEVTGRARYKIFVARGVVDAVEGVPEGPKQANEGSS
ncbi:MAG: hypothetical protein ACR2KG_12765 [Nocardioidaceae bacterium]